MGLEEIWCLHGWEEFETVQQLWQFVWQLIKKLKSDVMVQDWNSSPGEVEAGCLWVKGQPGLHGRPSPKPNTNVSINTLVLLLKCTQENGSVWSPQIFMNIQASLCKNSLVSRPAWWCRHVIPILGKWKQEGQEFKTTLSYITNLRSALTTWVLSQKLLTIKLAPRKQLKFSSTDKFINKIWYFIQWYHSVKYFYLHCCKYSWYTTCLT